MTGAICILLPRCVSASGMSGRLGSLICMFNHLYSLFLTFFLPRFFMLSMALLFSRNSSVQGMPSQQEDGRLSHGMMQRRLFPQLVKVIEKDSATCGSCVLISYLPGWTKTKTNLWLELAMPASSTTVHATLVESRPTTSSWARRQGGSKTGFGGLPGPPPFRSCVEVSLDWGSLCQDLWRYEYTIYSIYT